jgi:hypothetical protein
MAPLKRIKLFAGGVLWGGALLALACSPEARRVRDGGPGADPGNERLVAAPRVDPRAADTTLWPGHAPAPTDQLAAGTMPPPAGVPGMKTPTKAEQRAFTKSAKDPTTGPERR